MERIWAVCKPAPISSLSRLEHLTRLETLADRFDNLVWNAKASFEELHSVRLSIARSIDVIRTSSMDIGDLVEVSFIHSDDLKGLSGETNYIKDLESLLAELVTHNSASDDKIVPYFSAVFEGLCQYQVLEADDSQAEVFDLSLIHI